MSKKEQQVKDSQALKKAWIGNAVMLVVIAIGIILAVFAWFQILKKSAPVNGLSYRSSDDVDVQFNTYLGTVGADGKVVYDYTKNYNDAQAALSDIVLFPGETLYFQTDINNIDQVDYTGSFVLQNVLVNKKLTVQRSKMPLVFISTLENGAGEQSFNLSHASTYTVNGVIDTNYEVVNSQTVRTNISLPAAVQPEGENIQPGTATIYWKVILNGEVVDNDMMFTINPSKALDDPTRYEPTRFLQFQNANFVLN